MRLVEPVSSILPDGSVLESLVACDICGVAILPITRRHRVCSSEMCQRAAELARHAARYANRTPVDFIANRYRLRRHFACKSENIWLRGATPYGVHLPGGAMTIDVHPHPKWPVEHRNIRAVHGMMTNLLQLDGHSRLRADFSLVPWHNKFGWAVYLADDSHKQLATKLIDATLFDKPVQVKFGVFAKLKAPNWKQEHRGKLRIKVDTLTPVVIRADGQLRERPTNQSLHSGLTAMFLSRLGITDAALCSDIRKEARVHVVSDNTRLESIRIGGHFETVKGFFGSFTVEANASARWLLKCAQLIGLGGQTSIGFGRVKCQILE